MMKNSRIVLFLIVLILYFSTPVVAHKTNIFAWIKGNTVYTESYFSNGKKAKNSTVSIFADNGKRLTSGKTDEQGKFNFTLPDVADFSILTVRLEASEGHEAEFKLMIESEE